MNNNNDSNELIQRLCHQEPMVVFSVVSTDQSSCVFNVLFIVMDV